MSTTSAEYPEILTDLATQATELLMKRAGLERPKAEQLGRDLAEHIRQHWGGQPIYLTKGVRYDARRKHEQIWQEFSGDNYEALAKKFNLSVRHVYDIVDAMREEDVKRRQHDMFGSN